MAEYENTNQLNPRTMEQSEEVYLTLLAKYGTILDASDMQKKSKNENCSTVGNMFVLQNEDTIFDV